MRMLAAVLLAVAFPAMADTLTATRVSAFDYQTQDASGVKISDHTRLDTAIIACVNNPACVFVAAGRYKITRTTAPVPPTPTPTPTPANGTALLSWVAPTQFTDGSALTGLAGYKVYHGTSAAALTDVRTVAGASAMSYQFTGLASGTHYFAVSAYTTSGAESALSPVNSKAVP